MSNITAPSKPPFSKPNTSSVGRLARSHSHNSVSAFYTGRTVSIAVSSVLSDACSRVSVRLSISNTL